MEDDTLSIGDIEPAVAGSKDPYATPAPAFKAEDCTVFVRNLPYDLTDAALEAAFQDVGPVKRGFIVTDRRGPRSKIPNAEAPTLEASAATAGGSRGFGFVQFATPNDAHRAVKDMHAKELNGRKIRVEVAVKGAKPLGKQPASETGLKRKKPTVGTSDSSVSAAALTPRGNAKRPKQRSDAKHSSKERVDTGILLISGLKNPVRAGAAAGAEQADWSRLRDRVQRAVAAVVLAPLKTLVLPAPESTPEAVAARIEFGSVADAVTVRENISCKGSISSALPAVSAKELRAVCLSSKCARIIVRNLPFTVSDGALRKHLGASADEIVEISIPLKPGSKASPAVSGKPIIRGFAFIEFGSLQAAERGLQLLNSTPLLGRPVAADWALDKTMYTNAAPAVPEVPAVISQATATRGIQVITGETPEGESAAAAIVEAAEESKDEAHESGTVDHVQAEPSSDVRKGNGVKVSGDTAAISSDSDGNAEDAPPDDTDPAILALEREIAQAERSHSAALAASRGAAATPAGPPAGQPAAGDVTRGCTLFLRNVSYDTTEEQMVTCFSAFGPIVFAKLVMDKALNRPRGTAFVQFERKQDADRVLTLHGATESAVTAASSKMSKVKDTKGRQQQSHLAAANALQLGGRALLITRAVDRAQAAHLAAANSLDVASRKDRRNLYLAREGVINPDSEAAAGMSKGDLQKRNAAWKEKRSKLKNPNYTVSPVRLSVRNLPLDMDEKHLKTMFLTAAVEYISEHADVLDVDGLQNEKGAKARPVIKQVKVVRDKERVDRSGEFRSKRYGFVEFACHSHALAALRYANNHPALFTKDARPIVEFALEDVRALLVRERRADKLKLKSAPTTAPTVKTFNSEPAVVELTPSSASAHAPQTDIASAKPKGNAFVKCFNCKQTGHTAQHCDQPRHRISKTARKASEPVGSAASSKVAPAGAPGHSRPSASKRSLTEATGLSSSERTAKRPRGALPYAKAAGGVQRSLPTNGAPASDALRAGTAPPPQDRHELKHSKRGRADEVGSANGASTEPAENVRPAKRRNRGERDRKPSKQQQREEKLEEPFQRLVEDYKRKYFASASSSKSDHEARLPVIQQSTASRGPAVDSRRWFDV